MNVLFVQDNALDESQAVVDLAALLRSRGHRPTLLLDREERDLERSAREARPDLVILPCSMLNHGWARKMSLRLRAALGRVPLVIGGTAPTLFPDALRDAQADLIIRGEAERPVLGLLEALDGGARAADVHGVPGLFRDTGSRWDGTPAGAPFDPADLPLADKDLYYARYPFMRQMPSKRFIASRGCHHRCTYCYIPTLNKVQPKSEDGRRVRRKTPEQAVEDVAREAALGPLGHVHFSDDLFTNDPDWLDAFAPLYRERVGLPFTCNTSAELIDDRTARALSEAGCFACGFAVETGNQRLRIKVLRKGVTTDHLREAAGHLKRNGIRVTTFNMIALPGETPEEALETALLNADLGASFVRLNFAFPMPGTGMADYALEEGFLPPDWLASYSSPTFRYRPGPQFQSPHDRAFKNLFVLFRLLVAQQSLLPVVRRALSAPTLGPLHQLLTLQAAWNDKQQLRIPVVAGLKFFAHVGRPELRSTNFPALI